MYECGFVGGGWGWVATVLWWGLIFLAVVWFAREVGVGRGPMRSAHETDGDPAARVLRERYARGEIDTEEFGRRMAGLDRG